MMGLKAVFVVLSAVASISLPVQAQDQIEDFNTTHFSRMGLQVESVEPTHIEGLVQVITNQGLFYASSDGETLVSGRMFDITGVTPKGLSDAVIDDMRKKDIASIADSGILYQADDQKYLINVFTDTTCGYCRQLHERIDEYLSAGISIRYLAFPRGGMQSEGANLLRDVWCADDPKAAMSAAKDDQTIAAAQCSSPPIAEHYELGQKIGERATPAIVTDEGRLMAGFRPPAQLLEDMQK